MRRAAVMVMGGTTCASARARAVVGMTATTRAGASARPVVIEAGGVVHSICRVSGGPTADTCMAMVVFRFHGECI